MKKLILSFTLFSLLSCGNSIEDKWIKEYPYKCRYGDTRYDCFITIKDGIIKNGGGTAEPKHFECEYELINGDRILVKNCGENSGEWWVRSDEPEVLVTPKGIGNGEPLFRRDN